MAQSLGFLLDLEETALSSPKIRSESELEALGNRLFTLHWRLRQYSLDGRRMNFKEFARTASFGPLPLEGLRLGKQDLEIRGLPLFQASEKLWREVLSITRERHQAINWLLGHDPIYSMVTTDT